jgi:predicted SAM-dependent methyltransferase
MTSARAAAERTLGSLQAKLDAAGAPPRVVRLAGSAPRRGYELLSQQGREVARVRRQLARRFLHGEGLEIGALNLPLWMPRGASVRYVDRKPLEGLRAEYPEWAAWDIVAPDIVADGETLAGIPDGSADFVVANHFLEHTEDPIGTLAAHLRVLRPGGVGFYAVPDKRFTFDVRRPVTSVAHVAADHREGPERSRSQHFLEWTRLVSEVPEDRAAAEAARLEAERASIHFHVWTPDAFAELLVHCRGDAGLALAIEVLQPVRREFIAIVRKTG